MQKYGKDLKDVLSNPQELNSYSYVINNPLRYTDPKGQTVFIPVILAAYALFEAGSSVYDIGNLAYTYINPKSTEHQRQAAAEYVALGMMIPGSGKMADDVLDLGRAVSRINISTGKLKHVIDRHTLEGKLFKPGVTSYFNKSVNIEGLINKASGMEGKLNNAGFFERTFDAGRNIGVDRVTGKQTSFVTVIADKNNNLITAHPGNPGKPRTSN